MRKTHKKHKGGGGHSSKLAKVTVINEKRVPAPPFLTENPNKKIIELRKEIEKYEKHIEELNKLLENLEDSYKKKKNELIRKNIEAIKLSIRNNELLIKRIRENIQMINSQKGGDSFKRKTKRNNNPMKKRTIILKRIGGSKNYNSKIRELEEEKRLYELNIEVLET